jgi:hypothetical protein
MDDLTRYNEINKSIALIESYFDVLRVISNNGLFREIKSTSMGHIFEEMAGKLEVIKKLHGDTYEKIRDERDEREVSRYVSPF